MKVICLKPNNLGIAYFRKAICPLAQIRSNKKAGVDFVFGLVWQDVKTLCKINHL